MVLKRLVSLMILCLFVSSCSSDSNSANSKSTQCTEDLTGFTNDLCISGGLGHFNGINSTEQWGLRFNTAPTRSSHDYRGFAKILNVDHAAVGVNAGGQAPVHCDGIDISFKQQSIVFMIHLGINLEADDGNNHIELDDMRTINLMLLDGLQSTKAVVCVSDENGNTNYNLVDIIN